MADKKITDLPANTNPSDAALYEVSDGAVSGKVLNTTIGQLRKVGTALIGGDFTGNARGTQAIDLSPERSQVGQVASGNYSIAVGKSTTASGYGSIAIGQGSASTDAHALAVGDPATATGAGAVAIGYISRAEGDYSVGVGTDSKAQGENSISVGHQSHTDAAATHAIAIGKSSHALAPYAIMVGVGGYGNLAAEHAIAIGYAAYGGGIQSVAIGKSAKARIAKTAVITAPQIVTKGDGSGVPAVEFVAPEMMLFTDVVDLKVVADVTLTIPTGARFWLNDIGIITTVVTTMTVQPTIRFGITGTLAKQKAAAATTLLTAAFKRESFVPLVPQDGEATLTAGVTVGATATAMNGRFYFKGLLVENQ